MDPLTAGLLLAKALLDNFQILFDALSPEQKAQQAEDHFNRIKRIQDFADKVLAIFHKD